MRNLLILLALIFSLVLSGCSVNNIDFNKKSNKVVENKFQYREISKNEIEKFIPYGYSIVKPGDQELGDEGLIYIKDNFNKDILLFINGDGDPQGVGGEVGVKLLLLSFNDQNDSWNLRDTLVLSGDKGISDFYKNNITDLDGNGINEIFLETRMIGATDSSIVPYFITIKNGRLFDLINFEISVLEGIGGNIINNLNDESKKNFLIVNGIWGENEGHFGCHYYSIKEYSFENGQILFKRDFITKNRYVLDEGEYQASELLNCILVKKGEYSQSIDIDLNNIVLKDIGLSK